jgi:hypothetical protein
MTRLAFDLIDLTPPWLNPPETVVMHQGLRMKFYLDLA